MISKYYRNSKGLTLLELLAVAVILGIISIIATLAVVYIIDNTRKDAHIANAIILTNAAIFYMSSEQMIMDGNKKTISLKTLMEKGYINPIIDPHADDYYDLDDTTVTINKIGNNYEYTVALKKQNSNFYYTKDAKEVFTLTREDIHTP